MALSMLPAVAVVDAVRHVTGEAVRPGIKWVNDIVHRERKIAGVLAATQIKDRTIQSIILGIGLNIVACPNLEPTIFVPEGGCLNDAPGGEVVTLERVLPAVLDAVARRYRTLIEKGPHELLAEYRRLSLVTGRAVRVWNEDLLPGRQGGWPEPLAAGIVRDIAPDLSLLIEGCDDPVTRGRLAFEDVCRARGL
jgi:biotin-(acetyl-CoA carboxylase) ligase